MSSLRRRDGERVAGLLEFALSEPAIFCELIADGHHVGTTLMRMLYRAKGAAGICLVTDATAGAGLPNDSRFALGRAECLVRDGACWMADGSALAGSAARMIDLVRQMVDGVGTPVHEAVRMATETPARAMGWESKGVLEVGRDADLVVLSPELYVQRTFCRARRSPRCHPEPAKRGKEPPLCHRRAIRRRNRGLQCQVPRRLKARPRPQGGVTARLGMTIHASHARGTPALSLPRFSNTDAAAGVPPSQLRAKRQHQLFGYPFPERAIPELLERVFALSASDRFRTSLPSGSQTPGRRSRGRAPH